MGKVNPKIVIGREVIGIEVCRTDQALFLVRADMEFMLASELILAGVVNLRVVMQGRPWRERNGKYPKQNK